MESDKQLVIFHIKAAMLWLILALGVGTGLAIKLVSPTTAELFSEVAWLNFGRLRMVHTHMAIFGWISNGFLAFCIYAVPKLVDTSLRFKAVAKWNGWFFQFALILGVGGLLMGHAEGVEYAEAPFWADIPFAASFVLAAICILGTVFSRPISDLYVSGWYVILGFAFTALNFVMANTIVAHVAPGAAGAALSGLWIHNAVGLWVTPLGVAITYYLLPAITNKPIASHKLSLIGFWTLAVLYPLGGSHHYFYSPVPWWLQIMAVPLTSALIFVVYTVVYNFFATMKGSWSQLADNMPLRFLTFGIFSYIATCTQGPFHALFSVQKVIHFTDWVVAHAHLALFGVFSWWIFAFIYFVWPKLTGNALSKKLSEWHFWLSVVGFFVLYYIPDTIAGLMQGFFWLRGLPFIDSMISAQPFWVPRAISGIVIAFGTVLFFVNLYQTRNKSPSIRGVP